MKRWEKCLRDDAIHERAVQLGCSPQWADGIFGWAWHCTCPGNTHGADQQCSAITVSALIRETNKKMRGAP